MVGNKRNVRCKMPQSKLDKYLNILDVLVDRPQKVDLIARRVHLELDAVKRCLGFLILNGVVEKRRLNGKQIVYALTERGVAVFKTLRALKYLEKLRDAFPVVEEAREIASVLSKHSRPWKEEE